MNIPNFMGLDGMIWFQGVVEDRQDPKKLGRVRVRILGHHTEDRNLIPTQDLPWAYVITPITSPAISGIGEAPVGLIPGSWVVGWFRDGDSCQEPIIWGTIGGIPEEGTQTPRGFFDPRPDLTPEYPGQETLHAAPRKVAVRNYVTDGSGVTFSPEKDAHGPRGLNFPRESNPLDNVIKEPDTNRLARGEKITDTIVQLKKDTKDVNIPIAYSGTWTEPDPAYNAVYPYNHVKESESGHIEETDDTPGAERTHRWNRSGTFESVGPNGEKIVKIVWNQYTIVMKDDYVHIMGVEYKTVQKDSNQKYQANLNIEVTGNVNLKVHGGMFTRVDGELDFSVGGQVNFKSGGNFNVDAPDIWLNSGKANPKEPKQ